MHRLISSDMATVAGSRRAALGMTVLLHFIGDLATQFRDRPIGRCPNQSATAGIVPTVIAGNIRRFLRFPLRTRRPVMSTFREKAQGRTKQMVGQMIGDEQLVEEGQKQERKAEQQAKSSQAKPPQAKASAESSQAKSSDDPSGQASRH
jgi:uncharacterized protein YjbJ (UPF0337 family)